MTRDLALATLPVWALIAGCATSVASPQGFDADAAPADGSSVDGGTDAPADGSDGGTAPTDASDAAPADASDAAPADASDAAPAACDPAKPFRAPQPVPGVNTPSIESAAVLSDDELTIVFYSDRAGGSGGTDLYVARRASVTSAFGAATPLAVVNGSSNESDPSVSPDEKTLFFATARTGSYRIMVAERSTALGDFGSPAGLSIVNGADGHDSNPSFAPWTSELWFASSRSGGQGGFDLYRSIRQGAGFTAPAVVSELSSAADDAAPVLSRDGRALYFASKRPGGAGDFDVWTAERANATSPFATPRVLTELSGAGFDRPSWLSPDGCRLYLGSDRAGAGVDIYVAERMP